MRALFHLVLVTSLTACGVETASTAATAAALKKQEIEEGHKTMRQFQQSLDQTNQQSRQRTEQAADVGR